jgi:hypothetical protein
MERLLRSLISIKMERRSGFTLHKMLGISGIHRMKTSNGLHLICFVLLTACRCSRQEL